MVGCVKPPALNPQTQAPRLEETTVNVDGYFMPRPDQDTLVEILTEIPALVEDLTIAITRQDRIAVGGLRTRNGSDAQPLPLNIAAMEAADLLHDTLAAWTNLVCEQRNYPKPSNDTLTLGRWLTTHVIALALTEGAGEALGEIRHAIRQARRATDRPRDNSRILLGYCTQCETHAWGRLETSSGNCRTCGEELSMDHVRQEIDESMSRLILPAKEAAAVITTRYGKTIKPKSIYDMAYRAKNPIKPVELPDGTTAFDVRSVVDDLKRRGRIA